MAILKQKQVLLFQLPSKYMIVQSHFLNQKKISRY